MFSGLQYIYTTSIVVTNLSNHPDPTAVTQAEADPEGGGVFLCDASGSEKGTSDWIMFFGVGDFRGVNKIRKAVSLKMLGML